MKRIVLLYVAIMLLVGLNAQTVESVFKTAFPEVYGSLKIDSTTKYDPAKKNEYRKLYYKLSDALDEIKTFEIGAAQPDLMQFFQYKDLKKLEKDGKLDSLRLVIRQEQKKIADLMRYERFGADSLRAINHLMGYRNSYKAKQFDEAYKHWSILFHEFPKASKSIYTAGERLIKYKIKNAQSEEEKLAWVDTLMLLYDQRIKLYPKDKPIVLAKKAVAYYDYLVKPYDKNDSIVRLRIEENYKLAKEAIKLGGDKTPAYVYPIAMPLSFYMYKLQKITPEQFVEDYLAFAGALHNQLQTTKDEKKKAKIQQFIKMVDMVFTKSDLATCENYEKIFGPSYDSLKSNPDFLKKILTLMTKEKCTDQPFFERVAIDLFNLEPDPDAAYSIAMLLASKEKYQDALQFIEQAIELEKVDTVKANYYFEAAKLYNKLGQYSKARSYAYKALELKPNWGDPYILIALMYANSANSCGDDNFQHQAVYWAVVDKLIQAKNVDPSVAEKVNDLIKTYSARFPNKEDGFMHGVYEGNTYTIDYCWINETTKARYLK